MDKLGTKVSVMSCQNEVAVDINSTNFWDLWEQHKGYLYRCCVRWIGNPNDAEDVLSQAMIKAWEKVQEMASPIKDFKAWLTKLTYNLCMDLHRQHYKNSSRIESLDAISAGYQEELVSQEETPVLPATRREFEKFLLSAIDQLPPLLRETLIWHLEKELSDREIAEKLNISYENVRKRISQARAILRQKLQEYEGEEKNEVSPSPKRGKSQKLRPEKSLKTDSLVSSGELDTMMPIERDEPILAVESEPEISEASREIDAEKLTVCLVNEEPISEKIEMGASERSKKNCSGSVSLPRDLIGSETFVLRTGYANPLPIYVEEMHPIDVRVREKYGCNNDWRMSESPPFWKWLFGGLMTFNQGLDSS
jgi:RNA polymerase sigma factor (sigma-70 family)